MRRIAFFSVILFAAIATCAIAEEKKSDPSDNQKPAAKKTDAGTPAQKTTKVEKKAEKKSDAKTDSKEPAEATLDKDGLYQIEKNIVEFTNRERARHGLKPLEIDKSLVESARGQAIWMTKTSRLQHTRKPVGENIAMGYRSTQDVMRGWMNSKGHRANILNSGYRRIGVAAYRAKNGTIWWCQQFLR